MNIVIESIKLNNSRLKKQLEIKTFDLKKMTSMYENAQITADKAIKRANGYKELLEKQKMRYLHLEVVNRRLRGLAGLKVGQITLVIAINIVVLVTITELTD